LQTAFNTLCNYIEQFGLGTWHVRLYQQKKAELTAFNGNTNNFLQS